jgi:hypothetical protein
MLRVRTIVAPSLAEQAFSTVENNSTTKSINTRKLTLIERRRYSKSGHRTTENYPAFQSLDIRA